jgi:preprotein translocase subunit Sec61beta
MLTFLKFSGVINTMADNNQARMPSSQGGLVQYFDADTGIAVDPKTIIAFGGLVSVLEIALHMGILGI